MTTLKAKSKAFTLIELLIVIAIIAILAAAVIIAVNPGEQLAKARDATRERHVKALESALYVYQYDNAVFPAGIEETLTEICNTNIEGVACGSLVNLSSLELASIPVDPRGGIDNNGTGYTVAIVDDRLLIDAQKAETRLVDVNINGLVGWWKLDHNAENIAVDSSGYGNHGTGYGGITIGGATDRTGQANMATEFDGADDYVDGGNNSLFNPGTKSFSYSVWVYSHGEGTGFAVGKYGTTGVIPMWGFRGDTGEIYWRDTDSNIIQFTPNVWPLNQWLHLASVRDKDTGTIKTYINGDLIDERHDVTLDITNDRPVFFSRHGGSEYTRVKLDDVRIYNRALSESEIQSLYNQGL